jgi:hypothetical protein
VFPKPNQTVSLYWTSSNSPPTECTRTTCQFLVTHGFPDKATAMFDSIGTVPNIFFQAIIEKEEGIGKFWFEINDGMLNALPASDSSMASSSARSTSVSASASLSDSASGSGNVSASINNLDQEIILYSQSLFL